MSSLLSGMRDQACTDELLLGSMVHKGGIGIPMTVMYVAWRRVQTKVGWCGERLLKEDALTHL